MASKNTPQARDDIHFVNARPASETERLKAKRLVRAHVGRWISDQTKDRAAIPTDPVPSISLGPVYSATSSHGSDVRRGRGKLQGQRERAGSKRGEWPRSFPPYTINDECNSDVASEGTPDLKTLVEWQKKSPAIEMQISGKFDPFYTAPCEFPSDIIDCCQGYSLTILWPGLLPSSSIRDAGETFFPMAMSDPALYMAFMYGSLCHQRVQWLNGWRPHSSFTQRQERMLERCEMLAIQRISNALHDPGRADSDAVLLSVICMAHHQAPAKTQSQLKRTPFNPPLQHLQWLNVYGCLPPNMVHINGLVQLVKMRGGLDKIATKGLPATITLSDIMTTSCYLVRPVFEFAPLDESRVGLSLQEMLGFNPSDIERAFGSLINLDIGFTPQLAEALQGARTYIEIAKLTFTDSYDFALLADQRNLTQYNILSVPPANDIFTQPSVQTLTYEACRLAMLIFGVGVIFPIPAQNNPLPTLARQLHKVLVQSDSSVLWSSSTTLVPLIWVLCLGGIAASGIHERTFFTSALLTTAQMSRFSSWPQVKRAVEMMLWWDYACDEAAEALWLEAISIQ